MIPEEQARKNPFQQVPGSQPGGNMTMPQDPGAMTQAPNGPQGANMTMQQDPRPAMTQTPVTQPNGNMTMRQDIGAAPGAQAAPGADTTVAPSPAGQPQKMTAAQKLKQRLDARRVGSDPAELAAKYMSEDNRMMRLAAASGRQAANRRGLLSSSIAAGESMDRMAAYATDLAKQRSQQLEGRNVRAEQDIYAGRQLGRETSSAMKLASQQFGFQSKLSAQDYAQTLGLTREQAKLASSLSAQEAQQQLGLSAQEHAQLTKLTKLEGSLQMRQMRFDRQSNLQYAQLQQGHELLMQKGQLASQQQLAMLDAATRKQLMGMEKDMRVQLEKLSGDREAFSDATSILAATQQNFQSELNTILSNPKLSAEDRNALLKSAVERVGVVNDFIGDLYGIKIDWATGSFNAGTATTKPADDTTADTTPDTTTPTTPRGDR